MNLLYCRGAAENLGSRDCHSWVVGTGPIILWILTVVHSTGWRETPVRLLLLKARSCRKRRIVMTEQACSDLSDAR